MATNNSIVILAAAVFLLIGVAAAQEVPNDCGIAVYWGRHGELEGSLKDACDTGYYEYISIGLLTISGPFPENTTLGVGDHCNPSVGGCTYLGEEIKHCQSKGIKVLLSMAGGVKDNNDLNALPLINYLVNTFSKESNSGPFGGVALNGFDFAFTEGSTIFYYDLAWGLKVDNNAYLTASPGCRLPNRPLDLPMRAALFDNIWVRFFNDPSCDYVSGANNMVASWNNWMTVTSPVSGLLMGLTASPAGAQTGYMTPETLENEILPRIRYSNRYRGVAIWNRYYDAINNYSPQIKGAVCANTLKKDSFISQVVV